MAKKTRIVVIAANDDAIIDDCALLQHLGYDMRLVSDDGEISQAYVKAAKAVYRPEKDRDEARARLEKFARTHQVLTYRDVKQLTKEVLSQTQGG